MGDSRSWTGGHDAFAGKPATGKDIRVPYSVVYDLQGEQITALRIYLAMDEIVRQLEA